MATVYGETRSLESIQPVWKREEFSPDYLDRFSFNSDYNISFILINKIKFFN